MRSIDWLQIGLFVAAPTLITKPINLYFKQALDAKRRTWFDPILKLFEQITYRFMGVNAERKQN